MQLIDAHCHLDFESFDDDRDTVIQNAKAGAISDIIIPGTERQHWGRVREVCQQYPCCHPCYGLHPYWSKQHTDDDLHALEAWLKDNPAVAVGECGLDFRPDQADHDRQQYIFERQLDLAHRLALPVVIHAVKATEQAYLTIKNFPRLTGMIHSYSGSLEQAGMLINEGFFISLGGAVTYPQAKKIRRVATEIPLGSLLLETDAPDQPGFNHQGQRNQPAYLNETLACISELRPEPVDQIAAQTTENARKLFALKT